MPHFAAALLEQCSVTEGLTGCLFGFPAAHTFAHQLFRAFFNMQADFFGEIVVELAATEDVRYPVHWIFLLVSRGICLDRGPG
jgi:hypothetical protein